MADDNPKTQFIQLPFVGGLNEKTVVEYSDPAQQQASVVNGQFTHVGAIDKRFGMRVLGGANMPIANPRGIHGTSKNGLLLFGKDAAYSYSESTAPAGATGARMVGRLPDAYATRTSIVASGNATGVRFADFGSNLRMVAWIDQQLNLQVTAYNTATGATVLPQTMLNGGSGFPLPNGRLIQMFFVPNGGSGKVVAVVELTVTVGCYIFDVATMTWGAFVGIDGRAGMATSDATVFVGDPGYTFLVITTALNAGTYTLKLFCVDLTGTVTSTTNIAVGYTLTAPFLPRIYIDAHYGASELVWISYGKTVAGAQQFHVATVLADGTFSTLTDVSMFSRVAGTGTWDCSPILRIDATHFWQSYLTLGTGVGSQGAYYGIQIRATNAGAVLSSFAWPVGLFPWGKPLAVPRTTGAQGSPLPDVVMPCLFTLEQAFNNASSATVCQQNTLFLVRFPADCSSLATSWLAVVPYPICTVAPRQLAIPSMGVFTFGPAGLGTPMGPVPHMSCGVPAIGVVPARAAIHGGLAPVDHAGLASNYASTYGAGFSADFYFDQTLTGQTVELGDGAHISGGVPCVFDGNILREEVFFSYPEGPTVALNAGAGAIAGNYGWAGVYRYMGADGNEVRSAPAFTKITAVGGAQTAVVSFYRCPMSYIYTRDVPSASNQVFLDVYRTVANGSTYYLVGSLDATPLNAIAVPADMFVAWTDTAGDSFIQQASLLYTTGGVLDNVCPPASRFHAVHKNRLWLVDETGTTIWFSNQFQPGAAIGFNEAYTIPLIEGGPITALASMDDKLVIFKANAIYIVQGDPPPLTGIGSSLTEPVRIVSDVGTIDWRAVKVTPKGLIFRANAGIYILGRDLQVAWIGNVIKDTLDTSDIYSADLVPSAQHIRFLLDTGIVLVYDYFLDNWSTFLYAQTGGGNLTDATVQNGTYTVLAPSGYAYQEKAIHGFAAPWKDQDSTGAEHFVPSSVTTPGIKVNGVQGYQRVRRAQFCAPATDPHDITISLAIDNDPTVRQSAFWTATQLSSNMYGDQCEVHLAGDINKCESVSVTIADSDVNNVSVTGQGVTFTALGIEIDQIGKRYRRLPATARQ